MDEGKKVNKTIKAKVKTAPAKKAVKRVVKKTSTNTTVQTAKIPSPKKVRARQKSAESVALPTNMSLRSIEKSVVLKREFEQFYQNALSRVAYVGGLCFLLVGLAYLNFQSHIHIGALTAQIINSTSTTTTTDGTTATTNTPSDPTVIPKSEFTFISDFPSNIVEPTPITFEVTNSSDIKVLLVPVGQTTGQRLPFEIVSDSRYRTIIPAPTAFPLGYYYLRVYVLGLDGVSYVRKGSDFFIGSKEAEDLYNKVDDTTSGGSSSTNTTTSSNSTTSGGTTATTQTTTTNSGSGSTSSGTSNTTTTETTSDTTTQIPLETTTTPAGADTTLSTNSGTTDAVTLSMSLTTLSGDVLLDTARLSLFTNKNISFAELYARPVNSTQSRFIGLGIYRTNQWLFQFDTKNIPNGEYAFFAQTKSDGKLVSSPSLRLWVKNPVAVTAVATSTTITNTTERELTTIDSKTTETTSETPQTAPEVEADILIKKNEDTLNSLLERYASAQQTGDESLVSTAKEELAKERERIALAAASDSRTQGISDSIDTVILQRIEDLQGRIDTFEALRKQQSAGATAVDTDSDGLSDIDEVTLYKTDPQQADTDNDGFTDGIEIVRGFNPLDSTPEAVIQFESPKESIGLVRDDVLTVVAEPVVTSTGQNTDAKTTMQITGKGLPNSFVTLFIFSTPTVVTVRTDADGTFIYSFDKELDDGRHDVYVAVTDNTGDIIAQSNPFSFVKTAEAFTPVAATTGIGSVSPVAVTDQTKQSGYTVAVAIGILAFGLILFMFGISLRRKEEIVVTENITDTQQVNSPST